MYLLEYNGTDGYSNDSVVMQLSEDSLFDRDVPSKNVKLNCDNLAEQREERSVVLYDGSGNGLYIIHETLVNDVFGHHG